LSLGTDVRVESPPELVEATRNKALEVARLRDWTALLRRVTLGPGQCLYTW
jgi:hypothetical protein